MKDRLCSLMDEKMWKFLLVGVLNTLVGNGLQFVFLNWADWSIRWSSIVSTVLASVMSYFLNRYFTFQYKGNDKTVILRFALNIALCYFIAYEIIAQWLVFPLLAGLGEFWQKNLSVVCGMVSFVACNYLGQRLFTFREKKN